MGVNVNGNDDCWNRIGLWAKNGATCQELKTLVHCRNCEVYVGAGRRMLEREASTDVVMERTRLYARQTDEAGKAEYSATVFRIGDEWLAIPSRNISEITGPRPVHSLPHRSGSILLGVTSIRGELHLALSIGALLGIDAGEERLRDGKRLVFPRLVLMSHDQNTFSFTVDDVLGVYRYRKGQVQDVPGTLAMAGAQYVQGLVEVGSKKAGILDAGLLAYGFEQALN